MEVRGSLPDTGSLANWTNLYASGTISDSTLGSLTSGYGASLSLNYNGTGTLTNSVGLNVRVLNNSTGTLFNVYGILVQTPSNPAGGSLDSLYGVYLEAQSGADKNYGFYQVGTEENRLHGDVRINTAGKGLLIKEGTDARMGVATLSSGSVVVSTAAVAYS